MTTTSRPTETLEPEEFLHRHVGPRAEDVREMLEPLGFDELDDLIEATVPASIRLSRPLALPAGLTEPEALASTREVASANTVMRSYIGMGYSDCHTPPVIQRNILENPGWYTAYTPYQAEIAQGRLEALLNFQTMVLDLTGLEIANASLLDEGTAAAEAMAMSYATRGKEGKEVYFVSQDCHPQTIDVVRTRATVRGITVVVGDHRTFELGSAVFGALLQYPASDGAVHEYAAFVQRAHAAEAVVTVATDLLALTLLTPPGEWGADIAVGSAQRFGVPMGYGGPHAAFLAAKDAFKRTLPGRIIGVSRDSSGRPALRMALQTREQHIRREKATSNVCTAQVLLAVMAGMYAVYHGPRGLRRIAERIHRLAVALADGLEGAGVRVTHDSFFDTLRIDVGEGGAERAAEAARERGMNLRVIDDSSIGIALDETTTVADVEELLEVLGARAAAVDGLVEDAGSRLGGLARTSDYLTHQVFNRYHSETEMQRYMRRLESRDLSLVHSMIPLGSCTMKLNAAAEMFPISWPEFARMHPFAPREQAEGYRRMFEELESILAEFTGFAGVSLQPNAGSQGEFAGLMVIRRYHDSRGDAHRNVCLIPQSAHGTNPASAVMAGMKVVVVRTDGDGNIAMDDLRAKIEQHREALAALMVTYPSTHGVFEEGIREVCDLIHQGGGQVYLDGANMNAMVGLARPGDFGADVCHLNLHKTFCIPHGGGGPGMGPIGVAEHLVPFLPGHPVIPVSGDAAVGAISAAPWGSASILPISYMYVKMMGGPGLTYATKIAILNANYIAKRLEEHYPVLYQGRNGTVAHECILDTRPLKSAGIEVEDIAKRLIDYGFHAPTVSFPVAGTLMIEPTESESKEELDRFCDAMIAIREEVAAVERGEMDRADNPLKRAPHTVEAVSADVWDRPYSRQQAAFPLDWVRDGKFWPAVGRVESAYGDRNLVCSCPPTDSYVR